jgi:diphosphomevalonate decarboxylase
MSALALCLVDLEGQLSGTSTPDLPLASNLARLGSGSAARSVYGGWNLWGRMEEFTGSSDNYAIPVPITPAPVFQNLHDDILIISSQSKSVSSSEGHRLMHHHPYKAGRLQQARSHTLALMDYLEAGDVKAFIDLAETEALSLHALMMSSSPGYTLLQPHTLEAINRVRTFRKESGLPLGFSLDAGPNLHLLYPDVHASAIKTWIAEALLPLCENKKIIEDQVGQGPTRKTDEPTI